MTGKGGKYFSGDSQALLFPFCATKPVGKVRGDVNELEDVSSGLGERKYRLNVRE